LFFAGPSGYFHGLKEFVMSQLAQNEIIENALRKQVKLLPNDTL